MSEPAPTFTILATDELNELVDRIRHLERAIEHRGQIERAKGIIMHARGVDAGTAFAALRQEAQNQNRRLWLIAADLEAGKFNPVTVGEVLPDELVSDRTRRRRQRKRGSGR